MFQNFPAKKPESNEGTNALVEVKKTAEKVLPRGMKEGVACLQRFSSETDGLPGLDCGITGLCVVPPTARGSRAQTHPRLTASWAGSAIWMTVIGWFTTLGSLLPRAK